MAVCLIVKAELFSGAMRSNNPERTLALQQEFLNGFISLPFDDRSAIIYSRIRAQLAALGTRALRPPDCRYRIRQQLNYNHSQHP
ncbi:MAG: type II toxin-antitoxin system VapC family toxin [Oscillatoria sp. Prado101]|nr:type II toxin-antitoxin system VapC family toxin [Oscillatoria sp. Prado101]